MHRHAWYERIQDVHGVIIAGPKLRTGRPARPGQFEGWFVIEDLPGGRLLEISPSL